ncbi:MAG: hypothetical protein ACWIPJ_00690, partial [Polaribacter sp.]
CILSIKCFFNTKNMGYSLSWNNMLNRKYFYNNSIFNTTMVETSYLLRPSQINFSLKFRL